MKLLNDDGSPCGINFRKHKQNNGFVIRVQGAGQQTDFGVTPENIAETYEKAIDKRLEYIGQEDNAESWQLLASAFVHFLARYGIEFKQVTRTEFHIKGDTE